MIFILEKRLESETDVLSRVIRIFELLSKNNNIMRRLYSYILCRVLDIADFCLL